MKLDDKQGMAIPESSEFGIDEIHSSSSHDSSFFPWDSSFWGTNPKDKLKNIELIGIAALGLLLLSLFLKLITGIYLLNRRSEERRRKKETGKRKNPNNSF